MFTQAVDFINLRNHISSNSDTIVCLYFCSKMCNNCNYFIPFLEKLKEEFNDAILFNIDIALYQEVAIEFGVTAIPSIVIIKKGKVLEKIDNGANYQELKEKLYLLKHKFI